MFSIPREGSLPICDQQFVRRSPASIRTVSPMINICCHTHRRNWRKHYPSSESWNEFLTPSTPFYFCINCNAISSLEFFSISLTNCFIHKVLATLALSMGTLSSGLAKGYTSPALDSILDNQPPHLYQSTNNDTW